MLTMLRGVGDALTHARLSLVAAAIVLNFVGFLATGERWRVVLAALGSRLRLTRTTLINLAGLFIRNSTPTTGLGGDAGRLILFRADGVRLPQATAALAWVRLAEFPPIGVIVLVSAPAITAWVRRSTTALAVAAAVAIAVAGAAWLNRRRLSAQARDVWGRTAHLRINRVAMGLAIFYATLAQLETLVRQMCVSWACGFPLTFPQSCTVTAMAIVGGFVPTIGSVGAVDGSIVAALMLSGADAKTAVAITLVERLISYGSSTAAGGAALAWLGGRGILRAVTEGTWVSSS